MQKGFTLLELLMVLMVAAIITVLGVRQYKLMNRRATDAAIQKDVNVITHALDRYFHMVGCSKEGVFPVSSRNPSITDLGLSARYERRLPTVTEYKTEIIDTGQQTKDHKPIYKLQVTAEFGVNISHTELSWLAKHFNVTAIDQRTLIWQSLPVSLQTKDGNPLWILAGTRRKFRHMETHSFVQQPTTSGAYCAY